MAGAYVFGDFCSGRIWALFHALDGRPMIQILDSNISLSSFGQAHDGRLFVLDLGGAIFELTAR